MRSPGICTWERAGEACHEFHHCGHNREEKYGKFLNTIVQVSLFPTPSPRYNTIFLYFGKLMSSDNIPRAT